MHETPQNSWNSMRPMNLYDIPWNPWDSLKSIELHATQLCCRLLQQHRGKGKKCSNFLARTALQNMVQCPKFGFISINFNLLKILGTIRGQSLRDHGHAGAAVAPTESDDFQGTLVRGTIAIAATVGAVATALYGQTPAMVYKNTFDKNSPGFLLKQTIETDEIKTLRTPPQ